MHPERKKRDRTLSVLLAEYKEHYDKRRIDDIEHLRDTPKNIQMNMGRISYLFFLVEIWYKILNQFNLLPL